jgi:hypothetical protein
MTPAGATADLPLYRLHLVRAGYLFMGLGLAVVKWPLTIKGADAMPLFEGIVACLLTAMSLLAFLGLRLSGQAAPRAAVRIGMETALARPRRRAARRRGRPRRAGGQVLANGSGEPGQVVEGQRRTGSAAEGHHVQRDAGVDQAGYGVEQLVRRQRGGWRRRWWRGSWRWCRRGRTPPPVQRRSWRVS